MNVMLEKEDDLELVMEGVSLLETVPEGVKISSLFDPPRVVPGVRVVKIDFLDGKLYLRNIAG